MSHAGRQHEDASAVADPPRAPVLCVTVSYHSARLLPGHLSALLAQCPPPARVLVVDTASSDGSAAVARRLSPGVEVIENRRNTGYGAAANQGIAEAMAAGLPYVLLLNPDVMLRPGALAALIEALAADPSAAVAGPALDGDGHSNAAPRETTRLSGCALLLRTGALRRVGCFHPDFFLYFEETDLHCRLRKAGWRLLKVPGAAAGHGGAASSKRLLGGARVCYYQMRNAFLFTKRNCWGAGPRAWGADLYRILRWVVTPRRLLHPTRLVALGLGLLSGLWLLAVTRPVPAAERGEGPGEGSGPGTAEGEEERGQGTDLRTARRSIPSPRSGGLG